MPENIGVVAILTVVLNPSIIFPYFTFFLGKGQILFRYIMRDFPQEVIPHDIPEQDLNEAYGEENWKSMPDEIFWQLRFEPAKWTAEKHVIKVYVGTDGAHQDEFLRGDHPETMFKGSIATPSLEAAIINAKYVNSNPLDRISRDSQANGLNLSKQTMSNWTVWTA